MSNWRWTMVNFNNNKKLLQWANVCSTNNDQAKCLGGLGWATSVIIIFYHNLF